MYIDSIQKKNLNKFNKYYFNKTDLQEIVFDLIMNYQNVYYYLLSLSYVDDNIFARYSVNKRTIYMNIKNSKAMIRKKNFYQDFDHYSYLNSELLVILLHEVRHAEQVKIIFEDSSILQELFYKELHFETHNKDFYYNNHHLFAVERDATIIALLNLLKFLKQTNNKELYKHFWYTLRNQLLSGYYYNEFPNQKMAKQLDIKPIYNIDMDLFDRMKFGFFVSPNDRTDLYYNFDNYLTKKLTKK